jgi:hypothetical protein
MNQPANAEELVALRSDLAQALFHVEGKPLSLTNYPMYLAIYDGQFSKILLKTGRQVAKSTTIACFMIAETIGAPHFKTYYISPSQEQTRKFSHTRISKILAYSPELRRYFVGPESIDNVLLRMLRNGSEMAFTFASDDPDRARGFSADRCAFDEVQDIVFESVIPVIEECMSNSAHAYSMYCGTPKTMENTIEFLWSLSSQTEWCIKCDACGKSTFIDSVKALGKFGPICLNATCGRPLNPRRGRWVDMKAYGREKDQAKIKGFHISQPIMPENVPACWNTSDPEYAKALERWERILFKMENWGEVKFMNEALGVSTSSGARLLTKDILESLCDPELVITRLPERGSLQGITRTVAGIDWSGGGAEVKGTEGLVKSRTVLHIWGDTGDGRLKTLFYKIFPNGHASGWIDEIVELCNAWNVQMVAGDAGEGALANSMLRDKLGAHRVVQVRYMALSKPVEWNPAAMTYHADRTTLIDNFATFLTHRRAIYAYLPQMQPAINDVLNVYEEVTMQGRKVWRHAPTQPDDCLHAQLFGWFAWKLLSSDLKFYT